MNRIIWRGVWVVAAALNGALWFGGVRYWHREWTMRQSLQNAQSKAALSDDMIVELDQQPIPCINRLRLSRLTEL